MPLLDVLVAPHPALKSKAKPVEAITLDVLSFLDDMLATMYAAPGIGLAANQVGDLRRLVVIDVSKDPDKKEPLFLINPEIVEASTEEDSVYEEGCLSLPELYADVVRPARIKIAYLDRDGEKKMLDADGLLSTCIQHEIDHLDGVLFTDHLTSLKRNMIMRKLKKWTKENGKIAILENADPNKPVLNRHQV